MFGRPVTLFSLFGFEIKVDPSWLILAVLIAWSLATRLFPEFYKDLPQSSYWWMGAAGAAGLFMSIVFHELAHSLMARHFGISMKGITLFLFGGVAEMKNDPPSPKAEFWMAVVGPLSSAAAGALMFAMLMGGQDRGLSVTVTGVVAYLAWLNLALAVFNLVPAFPLDGGRILRSILWHWKKDLRWATSIAARVGSGLGIVLMALGGVSILMGSFVGGLWWLMIGFFVRMAALGSYRQMMASSLFRGVSVREVMSKDPVVVSRSASLEEFINDYAYQYNYQHYPVMSFGRLSGCVSVQNAGRVPRDEWEHQTVGSVTEPCGPDTTISPDESAEQALAIMNRARHNRLMVVENDQLLGVVSLEDMLKLLTFKGETDQGARGDKEESAWISWVRKLLRR